MEQKIDIINYKGNKGITLREFAMLIHWEDYADLFRIAEKYNYEINQGYLPFKRLRPIATGELIERKVKCCFFFYRNKSFVMKEDTFLVDYGVLDFFSNYIFGLIPERKLPNEALQMTSRISYVVGILKMLLI